MVDAFKFSFVMQSCTTYRSLLCWSCFKNMVWKYSNLLCFELTDCEPVAGLVVYNHCKTAEYSHVQKWRYGIGGRTKGRKIKTAFMASMAQYNRRLPHPSETYCNMKFWKKSVNIKALCGTAWHKTAQHWTFTLYIRPDNYKQSCNGTHITAYQPKETAGHKYGRSQVNSRSYKLRIWLKTLGPIFMHKIHYYGLWLHYICHSLQPSSSL
jgi:hypothetical protein